MKELLLKWAELEPERCRYREEYGGFEVALGCLYEKEWVICYFTANSVWEAIVQAALQEAIVAKGWSFRIYPVRHYLESHTFSACLKVKYSADVVIPEGNDNEFLRTTLTATVAESLLSAYLQGLEAMKEAQSDRD